MKHVNTKQSGEANGRPRIGLPVALGLSVMVLTGCAAVAHSGPGFRAMSASAHLSAACDLEERAKQIEKKFDSSARALLRLAYGSLSARGMYVAGLPARPEHYNPTYRYVVMARDLRIKANRHLAAAGRREGADREVCAVDNNSSRSYGGSWFWW